MPHCIQLKKCHPYWSMSRLDFLAFYEHLRTYFRLETVSYSIGPVDWLETRLTIDELQKLSELFGWFQDSAETILLAPVQMERYRLVPEGFSMDVLSKSDQSWHTLAFVRL